VPTIKTFGIVLAPWQAGAYGHAREAAQKQKQKRLHAFETHPRLPNQCAYNTTSEAEAPSTNRQMLPML
jgi:hypothetical protein